MYQIIRSAIKIGIMVNLIRITSTVTVHYPAKDILLIKYDTTFSNETLYLKKKEEKISSARGRPYCACVLMMAVPRCPLHSTSGHKVKGHPDLCQLGRSAWSLL